jgi:hypothetical protein
MRSFTFRTPPSIEAGAPRRILDAPSVFTFDNPVRSISPRRMTAEIAPRELQMSEDAKVADFLTQWTEDLQAMAGGSGHIGEAWSRSVLPFVACVTENRPGLASEMLADAREKSSIGYQHFALAAETASKGATERLMPPGVSRAPRRQDRWHGLVFIKADLDIFLVHARKFGGHFERIFCFRHTNCRRARPNVCCMAS